MKIMVRVKAASKEAGVEKLSEGNFLVSVKEKPQDGKANYAVRGVLADYFGIAKSRVILTRGSKAKNKTFEIL